MGTPQPITGTPGVKSDRDSNFRRVSYGPVRAWPGGIIVDGSKSRDSGNTGDLDVLRAGLVLGRVTASKKFAPSILGVLQSAYGDSSGATSLTVTAAQATEISRRIGSTGTITIVGPPTAAGTVASETVAYTAVNTSTGVITIAGGALSANYIAGSFIMANDGTETPLLLVGDGHGVKVTDQDDTNTDVELPGASGVQPLSGGDIDASQIIDYPSDASLKTWLKGKLNGTAGTSEGGAPFNFDDRIIG